MEKWLSVKGYEGLYEVSNLGRVRSVERVVMNKTKNGKDRPCLIKGRVLKTCFNNYKKDNTLKREQLALSKEGKIKTFHVHSLVAEAFCRKEFDNMQVNHKDGNPLNNKADNLEWITQKENIQHAFKNNLIKTSKKVAKIDIKTNEILEVYQSETKACLENGVAQGKISRAIKRNGTSCGYKWMFV